MTRPTWLKFVSHKNIEAHIQQGWRPMVPNAVMHHHEYGIEMGWYGSGKPPKFVNHRVLKSSSKDGVYDFK